MPGLKQPFVWFDNYKHLLHDEIAVQAFINTCLFVMVTTLLELYFGLVIALVINRYFRGRGIVRAAVLIPWAIPTVVASQMWRFIFNDNYGLLNYVLFGSDVALYQAWLAEPFFAFASIVAADIWKTSSFTALIILAGLQTIPDEIYDAAKIDGANA